MQLKMESIHYRVLGIIASFHGEYPPTLTSLWIADKIGEPKVDVVIVRDDLVKAGWLDKSYQLTTDGEVAIQEAVENPELVFGQKGHDWKDEALTGITKSGKRSDINHAALPSNTTYYKNDPEKHLIKYEITLKWIRELSLKFNQPEDKIHEMIKSGEINYCKGDHPDNDRAQIFGRDGNRWQRLCKKCRAKNAREKRRKKKRGGNNVRADERQ